MRQELSVFADYHQFYVQDEAAEANLGDSWSAEAVARMLAAAPGVVGVGTARSADVRVIVEVVEFEPAEDFTGDDLVTEATVEITSGVLVIAGCTEYFPDAQRLSVAPGRYRARIHYDNLGSVSEDGLAGEDSYRVVLWRDEVMFAPRVLHDRRK